MAFPFASDSAASPLADLASSARARQSGSNPQTRHGTSIQPCSCYTCNILPSRLLILLPWSRLTISTPLTTTTFSHNTHAVLRTQKTRVHTLQQLPKHTLLRHCDGCVFIFLAHSSLASLRGTTSMAAGPSQQLGFSNDEKVGTLLVCSQCFSYLVLTSPQEFPSGRTNQVGCTAV